MAIIEVYSKDRRASFMLYACLASAHEYKSYGVRFQTTGMGIIQPSVVRLHVTRTSSFSSYFTYFANFEEHDTCVSELIQPKMYSW